MMISLVLFLLGLFLGGVLGSLCTGEIYEDICYNRMRKMDALLEKLESMTRGRR